MIYLWFSFLETSNMNMFDFSDQGCVLGVTQVYFSFGIMKRSKFVDILSWK